MNLYAFELGRKKELCAAELIALFGEENIVENSHSCPIFKMDKIDPISLQNILGGTIRIIEIHSELPVSSYHSKITPAIEEMLTDTFKADGTKVPFAVNSFGFKNRHDINIKELLKNSKKILKSLGINSRFVNQNFTENPSPATIFKAYVLEKGIDISVIKGIKTVYVGKTVSIQNIDEYSKRDFGKPRKDAHVGMMPPKVAQIMINLAGPNTKTIYDPFCGTGTTLIEGLLMGKSVVGSDIDKRMTEMSAENVKWAIQEYRLDSKFRVFQKDAQFITKQDLKENVDAVVTEGHLGNPVSRLPSAEERAKTFRELSNLHLNWLKNIHSITSKDCKVIMCVGGFRTEKALEHLPKFEEIAKLAGYKVSKIFTYDRKDQVVIRDIKVLEKL